jgi:hypothetical protein
VSIQTKYRGKIWSDEAIYKSSDIYYAGHAYKEAIFSTGILATLKSKPTAKRREKELLYLSSLSNADIVILCDGA